jgi:transposase InsO family protein
MKAYPITLLCEVMEVSRSGFYAYLKRRTSGTGKGPDDAALKERIKQIFEQSRGSYGSRRIMRQLHTEGYEIGRYKVRRIMRDLGLVARTPKRFKLTTDSRHSLPVAQNVLDRKFDVASPNTVWTADITYGAPRLGSSRGAYPWNARNCHTFRCGKA